MRAPASSINPPTLTPYGNSKVTTEATDIIIIIICEAVWMIPVVHLLNITCLMSSSML